MKLKNLAVFGIGLALVVFASGVIHIVPISIPSPQLPGSVNLDWGSGLCQVTTYGIEGSMAGLGGAIGSVAGPGGIAAGAFIGYQSGVAFNNLVSC